MAILKKTKKTLKNHIGSVSGDLNSAFSKLKSKFGSVGNFSNSFDQRISDGLSDLLTGATGIRTSNIPEISSEVLSMKQKNREARAQILNKDQRTSGTPGNKIAPITFPQNFLGENNKNIGLTNYIHFRSLPTRSEAKDNDLVDIFLYVPEEMTDGTNLTYAAGEKSLKDSIIAKLMTFGEGTDQNIFGQIGRAGKEAIMGDIGKASAGRVINPMKFQLFEGVEFRTFSYSFILYPKDEKDSRIIRELSHYFKKLSLPGIVPDSGGRTYSFPCEWAIRYHGPIKEWIDYPMTSVLTKVETNQATAGTARMIDGAPVAVELTLEFQEVLTLDRDKYEQRVSAFTQGNTQNRENSQEGGTINDIMGRNTKRSDGRGDRSIGTKINDATGLNLPTHLGDNRGDG